MNGDGDDDRRLDDDDDDDDATLEQTATLGAVSADLFVALIPVEVEDIIFSSSITSFIEAFIESLLLTPGKLESLDVSRPSLISGLAFSLWWQPPPWESKDRGVASMVDA